MKPKHSALKYSLNLLSRRDYTEAEIKEKLTRKEYSPEEVKITIKKLLDLKLLDDERFTKNYVENQRAIKRVGNRWLFMKLIKKGVDKELIEKYLAEKDEDLAREAAEVWLKKHQKREINNKKQKLMMFLSRRGFNYDEILKALSDLDSID